MSSAQEALDNFEKLRNKAHKEGEHRTLQNKCGFNGCEIKNDLKVCSKCKLRNYCCREHQSGDWKAHKQFCRIPLPDDNFTVVREANFIPVSEERRHSCAKHAAKCLIDAMEQNSYPVEEVEGVFGFKMLATNPTNIHVGMDFPIDIIMYNVWRLIYKTNREKEFIDTKYELEREEMDVRLSLADARLATHIENAIFEGRVPEFFKQTAIESNEVWTKQGGFPEDVYFTELKRRNFRGAHWEPLVLAGLAGR